MAKYYFFEASRNVLEYVSVREGTKMLARACQMSEFQFLDTAPLSIEVDVDSGKIFPDFICDNDVPLVSDKFKDCLDELGVDYLFYKKIILTKSKLGIEEIYWLALPPRINCLNRDISEIDEVLNVAEKIVINDDRIGRYDIFKLAGVGNLEIIITDKAANKIKKENYIGVHISSID